MFQQSKYINTRYIFNGANRGLNVVVHVLNKFWAGQTKWSTFMYIISGRGRKSGVARATEATASLAPLSIDIYYIQHILYLHRARVTNLD